MTLKDKNAKFDVSIGQYGGEKLGVGESGMFVSIPIADIQDLFEVPCPVCQRLEFFTVKMNLDETYTIYDEKDIFFDVLGQYLRVRTNDPIRPKTIYIFAQE